MYLFNLLLDPYHDMDIFGCHDLECSCCISHKMQQVVDSYVFYFLLYIYPIKESEHGGREEGEDDPEGIQLDGMIWRKGVLQDILFRNENLQL